MSDVTYPTDELTGIMGVRQEITPILQNMEILDSERTGLARFHHGTLRGKRVVAVEIGVGKVNAAAATQSLIDRYHPAYLLFTGSAGGLAPDLDVGDVVVADRVAVHDVGAHRAAGFSPFGFMLLGEGENQSFAHRLYASPQLVDLAYRTAVKMGWQGHANTHTPIVRVGTVVTGDQFIVCAEKKDWLNENFEALAVEMEGSAVAQVASANNVGWLLIRAVSDHANHHFDFAFELWQDYLDDPQTTKARLRRARDRLGYMMREPQEMWRVKRFLDNVTVAARNAAQLTEAVIAAM